MLARLALRKLKRFGAAADKASGEARRRCVLEDAHWARFELRVEVVDSHAVGTSDRASNLAELVQILVG